MSKAVLLAGALMLVTLPVPADSAVPGIARELAVTASGGVVHLARHRARHHTRHAKEPDKARDEDTEHSKSTSRATPPPKSQTSSATERTQEKSLPARSLSTVPPPHQPAVPTKAPEVGKPAPEAPKVGTEAPPPPTTWSDAEVIGALRHCIAELAPTGALVQVLDPVRAGQCGTPAPVRLKGFTLPNGIEVRPPAEVNCSIVAKLHDWITTTLQPAAERDLGSPIVRVVTVSSYDCRNRIGSTSAHISEHAFANAIDIGAVVTADGRTIDVLTNWGPTARDLQKQAASTVDARQEGEAKKKVDEPAGGRATARKETSRQRRSAERKTVTDAPILSEPRTREATFLRELHAGACRIFGTVLGPEANEAHRNHLHFDLLPRKRRSYCE
jgi:hypothetical protein